MSGLKGEFNEGQKHELGRYIRVKHGFAFQSEHFSTQGEYVLLTPGNFHVEGGFRAQGVKQKRYSGHIPDGYILDEGQLLVAMTEQAPGLLGSAVLVPESGRYLHNQRLGLVEICDEKAVDNCFLFNSESVRSTIATTASGTKVKHTSPGKICDVKVWIPPLEEQRKIADILSTWDEAIEQQTRLLDLKRERKRGLMQQLLTGKVRFKEFEGLEWETVELEKLVGAKAVALGRGNVISKTAMDSNPGEYPVYSSSVKKNGMFGAYGEYMFDEELITWSVDGGGNFFHRPKHRFSITNVCGYMRLDTARFNYRFVAAYLEAQHERLSFDYQSKAHPSVIVKLYNLAVPTIQEQQRIAAVLSAADTELETLEAQLAALRTQKRGLMQQLLTGKTRVKVDAAPAEVAVLL